MKKGWLLVLAMLSFFFFQVQPGFSQDSKELETIKEEVKSLKEGQKSIQKDLQEIKKLLQTRQAPQAPAEFKEAIINIQGAPMKGAKDAKLVLMEFSDYQ